MIKPSLEWLSRHRLADPAARPHLFPARGPHPPTKHRTTNKRERNDRRCEKWAKNINNSQAKEQWSDYKVGHFIQCR